MEKRGSLFDVAVVGGGAAGMMAALRADSIGFKVCLLEGNERVGKKLLLTGDGRCNLTNTSIKIHNFHSSNKDFSFNPIREFSNLDTINFFKKAGLMVVTSEEGRVFPATMQASTVLDLLRLNLDENKVRVITRFKVDKIEKVNNIFKLMSKDAGLITTKNVIIATGGKSFPHTGSDGSGYKIAKMLGHKIIKPEPALVQVKLNFPFLNSIAGVRFKGQASLFTDRSLVKESEGEILFTNYGASGTAILNISREIPALLQKKENVSLHINLLPAFSYEELIKIINGLIEVYPGRSISNILLGIVNKKIIQVLLKEAQVKERDIPAINLSGSSIERITHLLTNWEFGVSGTLTFATAQVTAGGVDTHDIDPDTLESKLVKGLYFAGEVMDVDGDSGGYNLQWAWSSGWVAGSIKSKQKQ